MIFIITLFYNMELTIELLDRLIAQSKQKTYAKLTNLDILPLPDNYVSGSGNTHDSLAIARHFNLNYHSHRDMSKFKAQLVKKMKDIVRDKEL